MNQVTFFQRHASRLQWLGFVLGGLVITWSTLTPLDQLPLVPGSDKLHHLIGFGGWALMCSAGATRRFTIMSVAIIAWGGAIELIQPSINRYGEWADFFANSSGVILTILIHFIVIRPRLPSTSTTKFQK